MQEGFLPNAYVFTERIHTSVPDAAYQAFYDTVKDKMFREWYKGTYPTRDGQWRPGRELFKDEWTLRSFFAEKIDKQIDRTSITLKGKDVTGLKAALESGISKTPKKPTPTPAFTPTATETATFTASPLPTFTPTITATYTASATPTKLPTTPVDQLHTLLPTK